MGGGVPAPRGCAPAITPDSIIAAAIDSVPRARPEQCIRGVVYDRTNPCGERCPAEKQAMRRAAVVTISDSAACGERVDTSGPLAREILTAAGFAVVDPILVSDDRDAIARAIRAAATQAELVVTTGGTGLGPRD